MLSKIGKSPGKMTIVAVLKAPAFPAAIPAAEAEPLAQRQILANAPTPAVKVSKFHGEIIRRSDGTTDLVAEMAKHPDALWVRVKAIKADEENDNGDYFSREEVVKSYRTFEGCPVFTNHENQQVEKAKGKVVMAEWNEEEGAVYCTLFVDRKASPGLCRAIEEGYITDVSMGTQVDYSTCSVCGQKALVATDYCEHVKTMKGRSINGQKVFEKNFGLKFIEISVVTDGACKDCTIQEVLDPGDFAGAAEQAQKAASLGRDLVKTGVLTKDAGPEEISKLNQSLDMLEEVAKAMLDQRQVIDLDFLKDLADVLAGLQHVTDELVDQGYGAVGAPGAAPGAPAAPGAAAPEIAAPTTPMQEAGPGAPKAIATGPAETGVGKVTEPAAAGSERRLLLGRLKELQQKAEKYLEGNKSLGGNSPVNTADKHQETVKKLARIWENPSIKDFKTEVSEGDFKIVIGKEEVYGVRAGEKVATLSVASLDPEIKALLEADPTGTGALMVDALKEKFAMANPNPSVKVADKAPVKVAESAPTSTADQQQETMEAQLADQKPPLHPRANEMRESITEKQLQEGWKGYDFHKRTDKPRDLITEKQLDKGGFKEPDHFVRQDKPRDQVMEGQLRDTEVKGNVTPAEKTDSSAGVTEQHQQITEGQLSDWKESDKGHHPEMITEKQLGDQKEPWGRRIASKEDAKLALAAATRAMARTALATGATPDELLGAVAEFSASPEASMRAIGYADSIDNAAAREGREMRLRRARFHGPAKVASKDDVQNYLLGATVDAGMTGEVGLRVLASIASNDGAAEKIAAAIASGVEDDKPSQKPVDFLKQAMAEDAEESVRVLLNASDVKADAKDEAAFAKAAFALGRKEAAAQGLVISKDVHVAKKGNVVEVSMIGRKGEEKPAEKQAKASDLEQRKEARKNIVEAQMPGGGMPPGDPMAPGGTTMPMPPAGDPTGMGAAPGGAPAGIPALTSPEGAPGEEGEGAEGEAMPPGTVCPACGSENVDVKSGDFNCNECGATGSFKIKIEVDNWPGAMEEKGPATEKGGEEGGEGMPLPEVGIAQSFKVTPHIVKMAKNKPIGSHCPHCHSAEVDLAMTGGSGDGKCKKCKGAYKVDTFVNTDTKDLWATVSWTDRNMRKLAKGRADAAKNDKGLVLAKALKQKGLEAKFAKAGVAGKAEIIASLHNERLL